MGLPSLKKGRQMTYLALIKLWAKEDKIDLEEAKNRYPERLVLYTRDIYPIIWREWAAATDRRNPGVGNVLCVCRPLLYLYKEKTPCREFFLVNS